MYPYDKRNEYSVAQFLIVKQTDMHCEQTFRYGHVHVNGHCFISLSKRHKGQRETGI